MDCLFNDEEKIDQFEQIQASLNLLPANATDAEINKLINEIPPKLLTRKEDLMTICELFAIYGRIKKLSKKKIVFQLFEGIMEPIQTYLKDESRFFWNILGGIYYIKYWLYQKGLISYETLVLSSKRDNSTIILEYFLPEIIEKDPELFEKEIKDQIKFQYSSESIDQYKKLREKYFKWIFESSDYNDQLFKEIETDPLKYAIYTDDVESFQRILSNLNISIDSQIKESLIQNLHKIKYEIKLFEFALECNAIKIQKFLVMNNAELTCELFEGAILTHNLEMIHLLEKNVKDEFVEYMMMNSISVWDDDIIEYILNNYDTYNFLETCEYNTKDINLLRNIIKVTFIYGNFSFLKSKLIPFFKKNPQYVAENIYDLIELSFEEQSGFYTNEFLKYPDIDINSMSVNDSKHSIFGIAIYEDNINSIEIFLKDPRFNVNQLAFLSYSPLMLAIGYYVDFKIVKMICQHPKINISLRDEHHRMNSFELAISRGNSFAAKYLLDNFQPLEVNSFIDLFSFTLQTHKLYSLKIILDYFLKTCFNEHLINLILSNDNFGQGNVNDFRNIYNELIHSNNYDALQNKPNNKD